MRFRSAHSCAAGAVGVRTGSACCGDPPEGASGVALTAPASTSPGPPCPARRRTGSTAARAPNINTALTPLRRHRHVVQRHDRGQRDDVLLRDPRRTGTTESANSLVVQATPKAALVLHAATPAVVENCFPGDTTWRVDELPVAVHRRHRGLRDRAERGRRPDRRRQGQRRRRHDVPGRDLPPGLLRRRGCAPLSSTVRDIDGTRQPGCNFTTDHRPHRVLELGPHATASRPVELDVRRLPAAPRARRHGRRHAHAVRRPRRRPRRRRCSTALPFTTYQAYNNWGGKSLYDWNSSGANTVAGTPRAVKVSFDRPYGQVWNPGVHDWYARTDYQRRCSGSSAWATTSPTSPTPTSSARRRSPASTRCTFAGAHDEYWSAAMRDVAGDGARRRRRASSSAAPTTSTGRSASRARRPARSTAPWTVYKTTQSGPADPSGIPTGTWRDPAGANKPENAPHRRAVHRRQRHAVLPAARLAPPRARTASGATPASTPRPPGTPTIDRHRRSSAGSGTRASRTARSRPASQTSPARRSPAT